MTTTTHDKGTYFWAVAAGVALGMVVCVLLAFVLYACSGAGAASSVIPQIGPELTPVVLSGVGDRVIDVAQYSTYGTAHFRHNGSRNFIVWSLDSNGKENDLLVNDVGVYDGVVPWDKTAARLEIKADGGWTVELAR